MAGLDWYWNRRWIGTSGLLGSSLSLTVSHTYYSFNVLIRIDASHEGNSHSPMTQIKVIIWSKSGTLELHLRLFVDQRAIYQLQRQSAASFNAIRDPADLAQSGRLAAGPGNPTNIEK
jgi:hypothetical protein